MGNIFGGRALDCMISVHRRTLLGMSKKQVSESSCISLLVKRVSTLFRITYLLLMLLFCLQHRARVTLQCKSIRSGSESNVSCWGPYRIAQPNTFPSSKVTKLVLYGLDTDKFQRYQSFHSPFYPSAVLLSNCREVASSLQRLWFDLQTLNGLG